MNVGMPPGDAEALRPLLVALHLIAAALLVPLIFAWAHDRRRRLFIASLLGTVLAVTLIYVNAVQPPDIPIDWITVLHESMGRKTIMHLYTRGVQAGANFELIASSIAPGHTPNLHDVVWMNLLLALVNAVIFLHIALRIVSPIWAVVWTAVFALNPATFLASFSELPTHVIALYFFAGLLAWDLLQDSSRALAVRIMAAVSCTALTILVVGYRRLTDVTERRRVRVLLVGSLVGLLSALPVVAGYWWRPEVSLGSSVFSSPVVAIGSRRICRSSWV